MTSLFGCFLCGDPQHWADNCWTTTPPKGKKDHEERIALFIKWCFEDDPPRITPFQKRKLIEHENAMWAKVKAKEKAR